MPFKGVLGNNDQGDKKKLLRFQEIWLWFWCLSKVIKQNDSNIFVVHDPLDIEESFYGEGNIIVHGHAHRFRNEVVNGIIFPIWWMRWIFERKK